MARTPSTTENKPGRARRAIGFLHRLIRATHRLGRELRRANTARLQYNAACERQACALEDLPPVELSDVQDRNEWTLKQLQELQERLGYKVTPSRILRAVVDAVADAAAIGELDLGMCRSEAELRARIMTRLLIYSQSERDHAVAQEDQG